MLMEGVHERVDEESRGGLTKALTRLARAIFRILQQPAEAASRR